MIYKLKRAWWRLYHLAKALLPCAVVLLMSQNVGAVSLGQQRTLYPKVEGSFVEFSSNGKVQPYLTNGTALYYAVGPQYIQNVDQYYDGSWPKNSLISVAVGFVSNSIIDYRPFTFSSGLQLINEQCSRSNTGGQVSCVYFLVDTDDQYNDDIDIAFNGVYTQFEGGDHSVSFGSLSYAPIHDDDGVLTREDIDYIKKDLDHILDQSFKSSNTLDNINNALLSCGSIVQSANTKRSYFITGNGDISGGWPFNRYADFNYYHPNDLKLSVKSSSTFVRFAFYDENKNFISLIDSNGNDTFVAPSNSYYFRYSSTDFANVVVAEGNSVSCVNVFSKLSDDISANGTSIDKQTQQDKEFHDQEKQEESDRESQGNADADAIGSMFNFSVLNPFAGIFDLFKDDCTADIPIIAGWLGTEQTTYPSWWCANDKLKGIRSALTPVMGIGSHMLLFGFVIRRVLNGGDFDNSLYLKEN